ncbi:MAG: TonB-dependent receptor [Steroidobacteraceae bacterium]
MTIKLAKTLAYLAAVALLCASLPVSAAHADRGFHFDIEHESLAQALRIYAQVSGQEIIFTEDLVSAGRPVSLQGQYSAAAALQYLLQGTGLIAKRSSTGALMIQPAVSGSAKGRPVPAEAPERRRSSSSVSPLEQVLVVTTRRQRESAIEAPQSITVFDEATLRNLNIRGVNDYLTKVPDLSYSYGVGALGFVIGRSIAIRGISGAGTTGVYIDDTPIPDSINPQVLDIQRIEILKGPQGTLFGEGSLGGNVRLITNKPSPRGPESEIELDGGWTTAGASPDYRLAGMTNLPAIPGKMAVRVVAFVAHDAGFVTRAFPEASGRLGGLDNQGAQRSYGGSVSVVYEVSPAFTVSARLMKQEARSAGWPLVYAPQPAFIPVSYTTYRTADIQEYARDSWYLPSVEMTYAAQGWSLISSTSYFSRDTQEQEDGTEATQTVLQFLGAPATLGASGIPWYSPTTDQRETQEFRLILDRHAGFSGTLGARFNRELNVSGNGPVNIAGIAATGLFPTDLGWYNRVELDNRERSLFGEGYYRWRSFELTLGFRKFWLSEHDNNYTNGLLAGGLTVAPNINEDQDGLSPKYALAYKPSEDLDVYVSTARGYRAGGPDSPLSPFCNAGLRQLGLTQQQLLGYNPDSVWSYELGAKALIDDRRLSVSGAVYQMDWTDIQQTLVVPVCFIQTITNAGAARNRGAEFELVGRPAESLETRFGAGYDDSRITASGYSHQPVGTPVYEIPRWTVTFAATYSHPLSAMHTGFISADFSHVGDSLSGTTRTPTGAPLVRRAYDLVNLRIGNRWGTSELSLYLKNITNDKANLGDINPISFARIVNGVADPRIAILPPFQFGLQYRHAF